MMELFFLTAFLSPEFLLFLPLTICVPSSPMLPKPRLWYQFPAVQLSLNNNAKTCDLLQFIGIYSSTESINSSQHGAFCPDKPKFGADVVEV